MVVTTSIRVDRILLHSRATSILRLGIDSMIPSCVTGTPTARNMIRAATADCCCKNSTIRLKANSGMGTTNGHSDRTGPRRGPCRHLAPKGKAAGVHPGTAHGPTDSSGHRTSSRPLSVDICFRDSVVFTSSTCWHTMPRSTQSFPLSHPNHGELVFDSECS